MSLFVIPPSFTLSSELEKFYEPEKHVKENLKFNRIELFTLCNGELMRRHEHIRQAWKGRGEACKQHWKRKQDPGGGLWGTGKRLRRCTWQFGKLQSFCRFQDESAVFRRPELLLAGGGALCCKAPPLGGRSAAPGTWQGPGWHSSWVSHHCPGVPLC